MPTALPPILLPSAVPLPSTPPPPTAAAEEERRIDPADGNAYTLADFIDEYGGREQWDAARPVPTAAAQVVPVAASPPTAGGAPPAPPGVAGAAAPPAPFPHADGLSLMLSMGFDASA